MKKAILIKNILFGFGGQFIIMALGILVPRIMMVNYGSDTNGLLNTVGQIFTYMALLEAGIGQAAKNQLYKPIAEQNKSEISSIFSVADSYYKRITIIYALGVVALSFVGPILLKTDIDHATVFWIIFLEGISGVITFYFIQSISTLLSADGKSYINNGINVVNKALSYAFKIVLAIQGVNIILLQVVFFLITVAKVFVYRFYFKKKYGWINFHKTSKQEKLRDRNSYIITEIAWTMFSSTDMIVLSVFLSTKVASVYGVYNLVFTSLNTLLNTMYMSINYVLGQTFHDSKEKYLEIHDSFTSVFLGGMTILMSTTYILILPFIKLYTNGVNDIEYINELLPVMFCLVQILSWSRYITGNLSGVAGFAKQTSRISLIETLINITLSILLVNRFGIVGVLLATVLALPLKVVYLTWLSEKKILHRNAKRYLLILGVNYLLFIISIVIKRHLYLNITSYSSFFINAIPVFFSFLLMGSLFNILANPSLIGIMSKIIKRETKGNG